MSDHSVEDELISEARKFASAMSMTLRRYAQAATWLEKRKIRREITQAWRSELRQQQAERANELQLTQRAIGHFQAHSLKVAERANDPSVDHERRYRDAQNLARHRNDMAERVLRNPRLTVIEQGIALDGLDAASKFPQHNHGDLFGKAHRVKGLQALGYRATVARAQETAGISRPGTTIEPTRYSATVESQVPGSSMWFGRPTRRFVTKAGALDWLHRQVSDTHWGKDAHVRVEAWDLQDATEPIYSDEGRPDHLRAYLAAEAAELRGQTAERPAFADPQVDDPWRRAHAAQLADPRWRRERAAGLAREDLATPGAWIAEEDQRPGYEELDLARSYESRLFAEHQAEQQLATIRAHEHEPYVTTVAYLPKGADRMRRETGRHASESEAAAWIAGRLDHLPHSDAVLVSTGRDEHEPDFRAEGSTAFVLDEVAAWRDDLPATDLERELSSLKDRHRLSVQYNNALVERNGELTKQLAELTAERDELRETNTELTDRLAERTQAAERFASPERQAEQAKGAARPEPARDAADSHHGRDGDVAELLDLMQESLRRTAADHARQDLEHEERAEDLEEFVRDYRTFDAAAKARDQAAQAAEATDTAVSGNQRQPIPGHAFTGLVNGHDRAQEMER